MKKLNIIKSNTEPDKNNLWLKDGEIKEFNGSWKSITANKENSAQGNSGMQVFSSLEEAQTGSIKEGEVVSVYTPSSLFEGINISQVKMIEQIGQGDYIIYDGQLVDSWFYSVDGSNLSDFTNSIKFTFSYPNTAQKWTIQIDPEKPLMVYINNQEHIISSATYNLFSSFTSFTPMYLSKIEYGDMEITREHFTAGMGVLQKEFLQDLHNSLWFKCSGGQTAKVELYAKLGDTLSALNIQN